MLEDINFCTTDTVSIRDNIIEAYHAVSGRSLGLADPIRLFLYSVADIIAQQRVIINLNYSSSIKCSHKSQFKDVLL